MKKLIVASGLSLALLMACETQPTDLCEGVTCSGHGACLVDSSSAVCLCEAGYEASGTECLPADPCSPNPCGEPHRSTCKAKGATAVCSCDPGYWDHGDCVPAASCEPNPCTEPHRAVCALSGSGVVCGCDQGYVDDGNGGCVLDDPCDPNPCTAPHRTACLAAGSTAVCSCDDGYREDGSGSCIEACNPNPCAAPHQSVCSPAPGGYRCGCDHGFVPDTSNGGCFFQPPANCAAAHPDGDEFEPDECPSLATSLAVPSSASHSLEGSGDQDWFAVEAVDGKAYIFEASSSIGLSVSAFATDGVTLLGSASSPTGGIRKLAVRPGAGRFFVQVNATSAMETGDYSFAVSDAADDFANGAILASVLSLPATVSGSIDYSSDEDWFAISGTAGRPIRIRASSTARIVAAIVSADAAASPDGPPASLAWALVDGEASTFGWMPATDGTYYLRVRPDSPTAGASYSLQVEERVSDIGNTAGSAVSISTDGSLTSGVDYPHDQDWLSFVAPSSGIYQFVVEASHVSASLYASCALDDSCRSPIDESSNVGNPGTITLTGELTGGQTYYLRLEEAYACGYSWLSDYTVTVTALGPDDFGESAATATPITVGQPVSGRLACGNDQDWFAVQLDPGRLYSFQLTGGGNLYFYGPDGTTLLQSTYSSTSRALQFCSWGAGPYFLKVQGYRASGIPYSLVVTDIGRDDSGNDAAGATPVSVGVLVPGVLEYPSDQDWFSVPLEGEHIYRFSAAPSGFTALLTLFAADSTTLVGSTLSAADAVLLARATLPGTYFLAVGGARGIGAYELQLTDLGLDDHGDGPVTATAISSGSQAGSVQFFGDVDWLSIPATEGRSYRVTVTPLEFTASARLVSPDGQTELGAQTSSSPMAFPFSATASAPYFVAVSAYPHVTGSYSVEVEDLGLTQ